MEIYLTKTLNGLIPSMDSDKELLKKIKIGDSVKCKITRPRNIAHHRKYFAFLNLIIENIPEELDGKFRSVNDLLDELKMQLGYRELRVSLTGKEYFVPKSISFSKMDQSEFEKFYNDSISLVCTHILTGTEPQDLLNELVSF